LPTSALMLLAMFMGFLRNPMTAV